MFLHFVANDLLWLTNGMKRADPNAKTLAYHITTSARPTNRSKTLTPIQDLDAQTPDRKKCGGGELGTYSNNRRETTGKSGRQGTAEKAVLRIQQLATGQTTTTARNR
jgi:hypothetical protein